MGIIKQKEGFELTFPSYLTNCSTGESSTLERYGNYVPIDYIKAEIINADIQALLSNKHLSFVEPFNVDTGELPQRYTNPGVTKKPSRIATYNNIVFRYYTESKRMFISGSLHTLYNNGEHNYNNFDSTCFNKVLKLLDDMFEIRPYQVNITQIEWAVNISPTISPNIIINHCLFHKWKRFEVKYDSKEGKYHQAERKRYYILKIYNKGLQFGLSDEVLRFERKQLDYLKYCKQQNIGQTLQDLIDSDFKGMKETLLKNWNEILFFDPLISNKKNSIMRYRDPIFWEGLRSDKSSTTVTNHFNKLKALNQSIGGNIQALTYELIEQKINDMNKDVLQYSYFSYTTKTTTLSIQQPIKRCLLTHLDISMQKEDSVYLSHTGLLHYLLTNVDLFSRIKEKYLSTKWIDSDINIQIREIAHNIRTKYNDSIKKERKKYLTEANQYNLFTNQLNNIIHTHYGI